MVSGDQEALLRAILSATEYGIMLTDLDHVTIACNRRFGEIFGVDIQSVVHSDVLEVRHMVEKLIPDLEVWADDLNLVYADPQRIQEDELLLLHSPPITVRRHTGPVFDDRGRVIGRLWTFLDVSSESRRRNMQAVLHKVSTIFHESPKAVYQNIVQHLADHYSSNAVLSILQGDYLHFRAVASPIVELQTARGNNYKDSYCQYAIENEGPMAVQDASLDGVLCNLLPAKFGLTRYLGVPVYQPSGDIIGTLCILDHKSEEEITDDDVQFMSMIAMRVSAELAREAHIEERVSEKQLVVEAQNTLLMVTRGVLSAMNKGFGLIGRHQDLATLVGKQVQVLKGVLGYGAVGLFVSQFEGDWAGATHSGGRLSRHRLSNLLAVPEVMGCDKTRMIPLRIVPGRTAYLALARPSEVEEETPFYTAHLEALVEQVSLVLSTNLLQNELASAYEELKSTHDQLVQSEKLSVVGTLAASTAHDIKNILSSVTLELGMGVDHPEKALESVRNHMDRFSVLAHRLLSYAKPRLVQMRPVDIDDLLNRVLALTAAHTRVTGVTVVVQPSSAISCVLGDPNQLEHLFVNLVLNAVQAMHESGGNLTVSVQDTHGWVDVSIKDTGKGISPDTLKHLFMPFASTRTEGFGLGLYSCKRIVEEHGGRIEATSQSGQGTLFKVSLKPDKESTYA